MKFNEKLNTVEELKMKELKREMYDLMFDMALKDINEECSGVTDVKSWDSVTFKNISDEYLKLYEALKEYREKGIEADIEWLIEKYFDKTYEQLNQTKLYKTGESKKYAILTIGDEETPYDHIPKHLRIKIIESAKRITDAEVIPLPNFARLEFLTIE